MKSANSTNRSGFSLVEMLVVVSIAAIVLAISFPMIGAMRRDTDASTGINTITVAIPSIRRFASDPSKNFTNDLVPNNPADTATLGDQLGIYSGAAAIFTPAGEIRLTTNNEFANSSDFHRGYFSLELHGPQIDDEQAASATSLPVRELNGFRDLSIDYLLLPADTGVAGINRVSGESGVLEKSGFDQYPLLLPPPFAVWYNQNGYLVSTGWDNANGHINHYQFVYYDGNYASGITLRGTGSFRGTVNSAVHPGGDYNPDEYNPNSGEFDANHWNVRAEKYELPFDILEAVVGVYVYSRDEFQEANDRWDGGERDPLYAAPPWYEMSKPNNDARWEWMQEHGEMILFSKQTGTMIRNRDE